VTTLKILMLNHEFPPVGGGAAPVSFELSRHLVCKGHHVDVVTMHYDNLPRFETVEGVNIYRTPALRKRPNICHTHELATYVPGALIKTLYLARRKKYDIVHCHFIIPGGLLAWIISKLTSTPFLITCHGTDVPGYNPDRFKTIHKLLLPAWRFLVRRTPLLTSPSESLKELILKHCEKANLEVVTNGIYPEPYKPDVKKNEILMCSRIMRRKGFQYAIEAIRNIRLDWQVNVVGEGPYLAELKRLAEGSKTPVKFWGWLGKADPQFYELFKKSAIFIFPSEAENFPTVLLEAMAAGTAIITSTAGGCTEVVGDAALTVEPRDVSGIEKNLESLVASEKLRRRLSEKALERVQKYSWTNITQRYLELYANLLQTSHRIRIS